MKDKILGIGAVFGFSGVALGAFGAHGLKPLLSPELLTIYETGIQYHLIHAVVILIIALIARNNYSTRVWYSALAFTTGIIVFSGSLYVLAITGVRWLGAITPFGGIAFLVGWFLLLLESFGQKKTTGRYPDGDI
ncbi:DUF423 domain-containing protein [bacterium]|nr:DUF423 domain-containing protein [bacterium]